MTEMNLYRIYYNQRTTEVVASSFEMKRVGIQKKLYCLLRM